MKTQMGLIKIEINIAEIKKALTTIKSGRIKIFEAISIEIKQVCKKALEEFLESEITLFLGSSSEASNKRNGYSIREFAFKGVGSVTIKVPRDRNGNFSSQLIPKNEQIDPRLKEDMAVLHLAGLSSRTLALISKRILGATISADTATKSLDTISEKATQWLERPITNKYWALYVDGTFFKVQRKSGVEKEPNLIVLGIDQYNRKSILAIEHGFKENKDNWAAVFESLKKRGLDSSFVKIGVMDGLPGLEEQFKESFSNADTARCWCHSMNNALLKTPAKIRDIFKKELQKIMYSSTEESGREAFNNLKDTFESQCHRAVRCIEKDLNSLLIHLKFEPEFQLSLKTTNPIERVNKEFKRRTKSMETIGEANLRCILAFTALKLEMGWMSKTVNSKAQKSILDFNKKRMNQIEDTMELLLH